MPRNRRELLVRRLSQADRNVVKAMWYLSEMAVTFDPYYPYNAAELRRIIGYMEFLRALMKSFHLRVFSKKARHLLQAGDTFDILVQAKPVADPHYEG